MNRKKAIAKTDMDIIPMDIPFPGFPLGNTIESDNHTLITQNNAPKMIPLEEDGFVIPGLFEQLPEFNLHKLYIGDFMDRSAHGFNKIINKLQEAPHGDVLELHISSYGGSFAEVVQIHNIIDSMYSTRSTSYLNHGYSGGAMAFVMCKERIVYEHSVSMFHFFSGGEVGKGYDMLTSLTHSISTIGKYYRNMLKDYFTPEELDLMIIHGKEFWLSSIEMLKRNIATGIIISGQYYTKAEYFEKYDEDGSILQLWIDKNKETQDEEEEVNKLRSSMYDDVEKQVEKFINDRKKSKEIKNTPKSAPKKRTKNV